MYTTITQSKSFKSIAILVSFAMLSMSFTAPQKSTVTLNSGTLIPLETVSFIQSDLVLPGQTIDFLVPRDVMVDDKVVIAAGSIARGQVVRSQKAKGLGREGFVEIQIKTVKAVDGQEIYLTGGNLYQEGEDRQGLAIALGVIVCILFLTIKGKNAVIPSGYSTDARVAGNTTIKI